MLFIDCHCHLDFAAFDADRDHLLMECGRVGIKQILVPGVDPQQWLSAKKLFRHCENIYRSIGLHPWWIDRVLKNQDLDNFLTRLRQQVISALAEKNSVAIGECGLDMLRAPPLGLQQKIFELHLSIAAETSLPLIIHCHKAHNEVMVHLNAHNLAAGGVIHGFSGSYELAKQYWNKGFHLGIGGTITYDRAQKTRDAVKKLPLDALLLETDAPDMPLQGEQGQRNSPINILRIAQTLAELRGESLENIATQTTRNAQKLFNIPVV